MVSAIDRKHCPLSIGIAVRLHRNPQTWRARSKTEALETSERKAIAGAHWIAFASKSHGSLDLRDVGKRRYRRPIHDDGADGAHHRGAQEHLNARSRRRII